ncbi:hypothetical protein L3Q82_002232 [Scortum barcoo]|uniref:Uncharacterized protein n=1 Tax=Scortum barcoo TaxID=214431 RepID=A0ACB8W0Q8_9TELE|nr:hypothetical protein L3Q82_002232 [Scortum barcoo]
MLGVGRAIWDNVGVWGAGGVVGGVARRSRSSASWEGPFPLTDEKEEEEEEEEDEEDDEDEDEEERKNSGKEQSLVKRSRREEALQPSTAGSVTSSTLPSISSSNPFASSIINSSSSVAPVASSITSVSSSPSACTSSNTSVTFSSTSATIFSSITSTPTSPISSSVCTYSTASSILSSPSLVPPRPSPPPDLPVCAKNISLTASGEKVILWTREADRVILTMCQQEGANQNTFQAISTLLGNKTPTEVSRRFRDLMRLFRTAARHTSSEDEAPPTAVANEEED